MSIDIDWETLTTGPEGIDLANSIRDFIHDKFQQVQLPRFIRSVNVHSFDFGKECPTIELKDISDPLPEFYEDEEDTDKDQDEDEANQRDEEVAPSTLMRPADIPSAGTSTKNRNHIEPHHLPNPRSINGTTQQDPGGTPFLSCSSTPGIPGGTSNFSYFHLPLSTAGLSGTQTPLSAAVSPFPSAWHNEQSQQHHPPVSSLRYQTQQPQQRIDSPLSRPHPTDTSFPPPPPFSPQQTASPPAQDRTHDLQTTLHIAYIGSLSLLLTAEILLDYPMPSFVGIPLKLQITGLSFDGTALVAYLRQREGRGAGSRVCFCFLEEGGVEGGGGSGDNVGQAGGNGDGGGGLLREIKVESEIGRQEGGKQVLKNVGKVEKFVLEQVRRIFEEEFVWPSFWTVLV
ncbi:Mitochondrial distribution and morphology protein 12 [Lecanora helva]